MFYSESRQKLVEDCGVIEVMVAAVDVVIDEGEEVVEELFALVDQFEEGVQGIQG